MVAPVMDNLFADIYYFFVPNRIIWKHFKQFMGENEYTAWYPTVQYNIPKVTIPAGGVGVGSVLDYLGIPPWSNQSASVKVNALRLRGYLKICNEWFRDQNLENSLNLTDGDADVTYSWNNTEYGGKPFVAAKMHDYFTSCLPGPQKAANPVEVPVSGFANVITSSPNQSKLGRFVYPAWYGKIEGYPDNIQAFRMIGNTQVTNTSSQNVYVTSVATNNPDVPSGYAPYNLIAQNSDDAHYTISVTDLRLAFQTQKFLEKQARGGSRYREILLSHFGVVSPDARQQVPEYLGGNRIPIQIQQVVNQAESANQPLGNLGAYSQTTDIHEDVFKSFTEHGYIYGLCVLRYDHTYAQGVEHDWWLDSMYDFYWPVFANISEQPIYSKEIWYGDAQGDIDAQHVFGYQEAWASYRYKLNRCAGEMRPQVTNGLYSWTFADAYNNRPTLSGSWIKEDPANVDRCLAVSSAQAHQFWADFYVKCETTRPMPVYSIPGLVDHF